MNITTFSSQHIPQALGLSTQVGWNHIEQDWLRCIDLNPQGCMAGFVDGQLVATTTLNQFGDLGWIGTFLVDKAHQRKGHGSLMFQEALRRADALGITWIGLDSTEVGRPIYSRFGFLLDEPIERWTGPNHGLADTETEPLSESLWPALLNFDRECVDVDRHRQLRHLASEPGTAVRVLCQGGRVLAFGFSRSGRLAGSIGPLVAHSETAARQIIESLLSDRRLLDGDRPIALDLLGHEDFKAFLAAKGFAMRRRNIRMFRPAKKRLVFTGQNVFAATGLGMG